MNGSNTAGTALPALILSGLLFSGCGSSSSDSGNTEQSVSSGSQSTVCNRIQSAGIPMPQISDGINNTFAATFDGNCAAFQQYSGGVYTSTVNGVTTTIRQENNGDFVLMKDGTSTSGGGTYSNWVAYRFQSQDSGDVQGIFDYYNANSTELFSRTTYYRDGRAHYDFNSSAPDTYYFPGQSDQRFITDFGFITIGANQFHNGYTVVVISNRIATTYKGCEGDLTTFSTASATALSNACNSNSAESL